jgi:signal peptidase I
MIRKLLVGVVSTFFVIVLLLSILRICGFRQFSVPTSSMAPTIPAGSHVVAYMSAYRFHAPQRWDVVLFDPPSYAGQGQIWDKRVVGLPGEQVNFSAKDGILINGRSVTSPPQLASIKWKNTRLDSNLPPEVSYPYTVPADSYFVLGDNPDKSSDSRFWGAVPRKNILGKVIGK